ncbi:MAG: hypothetical protein ABWK05_08505 [Pyrobaculum sp.]
MAITTSSIDDLVLKYFQTLVEKGLDQWVDEVFPSAETFRIIENLAGSTAEDVIERVARVVVDKVHPGVAGEVVGAAPETARWILARRIAYWYLQLALELGVVRERR